MRRRTAALFTLAAALAGCGYTGDPLPPALWIPTAVQDLSGRQRGDAVILGFSLPSKTTEDLVLKSPPEMEIRAGANPEGGFDLERWLAASERLPAGPAANGRMEVRAPAARWAGKEMVFAVRAIGPRGRASAWSNLLTLRIAPPPETPSALRATATPQGVLLVWNGAGSAWRVWRRPAKAEPALLAQVQERRYLDASAGYGSSYEYSVQQVEPAGAVPAESEMSAPASIDYQDVFPPAPPSELTAIAGPASIELNWNRSLEPDWKAFQVWRSAGGGPLERLGAPVVSSAYSDRAVESGKRYRYAISSLDQRGNESAPCAPVEIVAP